MDSDANRKRNAHYKRASRVNKRVRAIRYRQLQFSEPNDRPIRLVGEDEISAYDGWRQMDNACDDGGDDDCVDDNNLDQFYDARDQLLCNEPVFDEPVVAPHQHLFDEFEGDDADDFYDCQPFQSDDDDDEAILQRDTDDIVNRLRQPEQTLFVKASLDYAQSHRKSGGDATVEEIATQTRAAIELRSLLRGQSRKIIELILVYGRYA